MVSRVSSAILLLIRRQKEEIRRNSREQTVRRHFNGCVTTIKWPISVSSLNIIAQNSPITKHFAEKT